MRIQTNDPDRPWQQVVVTGRVEKFAEIRPERVLLKGQVGKDLFEDIEIIPQEQHPFTIRKIIAKNGKNIDYAFTERCTDGKSRCVLRVSNTSREKGSYVDVLNLRTDSDIHPNIPIYITGMIQ